MRSLIRILSVTILMLTAVNSYSQQKKKTMKQYSLLVRVPETYGGEQAKSVSPQWDKLLEDWKKAGVYILSFPFPGESYTVSGADKIVKKETVLSDNKKVVSHLIIQAESLQQAVQLAKAVPVLFYDGTVEVREISKPVVLTK